MNISNILNDLSKELFSESHELFRLLVTFSILDSITGICVAIHQKKLSSKIGHKGITRKMTIFILVGICSLIDEYLGNTNNMLYTVCTIFYISNELISIFENALAMGIPIPEQLNNALESLKRSSK